ncbi:hypothetical protein [Yoonia litorea]|uniref:hypothetical protein n=1 Tax=Yoonia litorea TaxID=1123755 RepID=UPI001042303A|nr:hypothetical protein [Yoonia litorea]
MKDILRGCFATYVAGTALLFVAEIPAAIMGNAIFGLTESLFILVFYGALLAALLTLIILAIWLCLAFLQIQVLFPVAPLVAAVLISLPMTAEAGVPGFLLGVFFGALAGVHFWFWAFGTVWRQEMRFGATSSLDQVE